MNRIYWRDYIPFIALLFIGGYFFVCNFYAPLFADDHAYAFIWDGANGGNLTNGMLGDRVRVKGIGDILISQYSHYFYWGGRNIAHFLVQFFVFEGKMFFNIVNTAAFLAVILLVYKIAIPEITWRSMRAKQILWIFFFLWACNPAFLQTTIWLTGSCNYLWMLLLQMIFLLFFAQSYFGKETFLDKIPFANIIAFFVGLLAGWTNENSGLMIIGIVILFLYKIKKEKLEKSWMLYSMLGLFLGYAIMMLAPGNFARSKVAIPTGMHMAIVFANIKVAARMFLYNLVIWLPTIYFLLKKSLPEKEKFLTQIFLLAGSLNILVMIAFPFFPERAAFSSTAFFCIALICASYNRKCVLREKPIQKICTIMAGIYLLITLSATTVGLRDFYRQTQNRYNYINLHKQEDVIVEPYHLNPRWQKIARGHTITQDDINIGDVQHDVKGYQNMMFSAFFDLKTVRIK